MQSRQRHRDSGFARDDVFGGSKKMDEIKKESLDEPFIAPYNPRTQFARRERVADDSVPVYDFVHLRALGRVGLDHVCDEGFHELEPIALLDAKSSDSQRQNNPTPRTYTREHFPD